MLHFEIFGNGKQDLILLHGFMENMRIWEDMETMLSKNFRIIKIDLPGHGRSPVYGEIHTMDFMAKKVEEVVDHLKIHQFHLLGHSMGGYVSLAFAEKFPKRLKSLTLFFSTFLADDEEKKEMRKKSFRIIQENYKTYVSAGIPNFFNPNERDILEGKIELAKEIAFSTDPKGVLACQKGMIERKNQQKVMDELEAKILVIAGKYDNAIHTTILINHLPNRTNLKSYVLDCGHNGHFEKPEVCAAILNTELLHNLPKNLMF